MSVIIRDLAWPDLPRVEDVERRLFPQDAWPSATWWAELAERPRRDYVVAVDDSRVLGYAGADHGGATTDIMTIAVDPGIKVVAWGDFCCRSWRVARPAAGPRRSCWKCAPTMLRRSDFMTEVVMP